MPDPDVPEAPDQAVPPSALALSERRSGARGHLQFFWNLIFRALRRMGGHAEKFYVTVGIFLLVVSLLVLLLHHLSSLVLEQEP